MIVRDPRDNIRSAFDRMGLPGNREQLDPDDLQAVPPNWRWHLNPEILGLAGGTYVEVAAERWNRAASVYLSQRDDMVLIRYEDFLADKTGAIQRLADLLDLPILPRARLDLDRQYQPRGRDRDRPVHDFFGPDNLRRIERICAEPMRRLGYQPVTGQA